MEEILQFTLAGAILLMPIAAFLYAISLRDASRIVCRRSLPYWGSYVSSLVYLEVCFIAAMQALLLIHCAGWIMAAAPFVSLGSLVVSLIVGGVVYGNMLRDSRDARIGFLRGLLVWLVSSVWWVFVAVFLMIPLTLIILLSVEAGVGTGSFWVIVLAASAAYLVGIYCVYRFTIDEWLRRRVRLASNSPETPRTSAAAESRSAPIRGH